MTKSEGDIAERSLAEAPPTARPRRPPSDVLSGPMITNNIMYSFMMQNTKYCVRGYVKNFPIEMLKEFHGIFSYSLLILTQLGIVNLQRLENY